MIENKAIRKLNHALTDKQVARDPITERDHKDDGGKVAWTYNEIMACETAWGHGALIFAEPAPAFPKWYATIADRSAERLTAFLADLADAEKRPVWPVMVGETMTQNEAYYEPHEGQQLVEFNDRNGGAYIANGAYIATILKKNRRHLDALKWYLIEPGPHAKIVADLAGEIVAALAPMRENEAPEWQWNLINRDLPPELTPYNWDEAAPAGDQIALF